MKTSAIVSILLLVICFFLGKVHSGEALFLTGIVKSLDSGRGILKIDVTSEACRGLREFSLPPSLREEIDETLLGRRIEFYIDSPRCEAGRVYTIRFEKP